MGSSSEDVYEDEVVVETDSTGRFLRYDEVLEEGLFKKDYKGFDELKGLEIVWSKIELPTSKVFESEESIEKISSEFNLLKSLKHENVMRCCHYWVDRKTKIINMISQLFTSGTIGQYRKKHTVNKKAIKKWGIQILKGLDYLHCQSPPIVHKDLNCDNIFMSGHSGKVWIGNLGLTAMFGTSGKPEFMAPEFLSGEGYDQRVDVYSFGMCMLQMVTREVPYSECRNKEEVYEKVGSEIKPEALSKVADLELRELIEKCLGPASERLTASELMNDPFFAVVTDSNSSAATSRTESLKSDSVASWSSITWDQMVTSPGSSPPRTWDQMVTSPGSSPPRTWNQMVSPPAAAEPVVEPLKPVVEPLKPVASENIGYNLHGDLVDTETISMVLRIGDFSSNEVQKIKFPFCVKTDTSQEVVKEMVKEIKLSAGEAVLISELMENLIRKLIPGYKSSSLEVEAEESSASKSNVSQHFSRATMMDQNARLSPPRKILSEQDNTTTSQDNKKGEGNVTKRRSTPLKKLLFCCVTNFRFSLKFQCCSNFSG